MTVDINTVLGNLNQLLTNTLNITSVYYNVFFNTTPMDVTLQQYDSNGILQTYVIPNRAKDRQICLSGTTAPENNISAVVGTFYINTLENTVYVKIAGDSTVGWLQLLTLADLQAHNTSPSAHLGILAELNGSETVPFRVATPSADNQAVNRKYTGNIKSLITSTNSSLVSAINENFEQISYENSRWCLKSGYINPLTGRNQLLSYPILDYNNGCTINGLTITGKANAFFSSNATLPTTDVSYTSYSVTISYTHSASKGTNGGYILSESTVADKYKVPQVYVDSSNSLVFNLSTDGSTWNVANGERILSNLVEGTKYILTLTYSSTAGYSITQGSTTLYSNTTTNKIVGGSQMILLNNPTDYATYFSGGSMDLSKLLVTLDGVIYLSGLAYNKIIFNAGGYYNTLLARDINGNAFSRTSTDATDPLSPIDTSSLTAGNYLIFIPKTGIPYVKKCNYVIQDNTPDVSTATTDVLWQANNINPFSISYYTLSTTSWNASFSDILAGSVIVNSSNQITKVVNFPYNYNGCKIYNNRAGRKLISSLGMPSTVKVSYKSSVPAQNTTYTVSAPANGYFELLLNPGTCISLINTTRGLNEVATATSGGQSKKVECLEGDSISAYYTGTLSQFNFIYAEGEI